MHSKSVWQLTFARQFLQNPLIVINSMLGTKSLRALRCSQRLSNAPACRRIKIASESTVSRWFFSSSQLRRAASWDACRFLLSLNSRLKKENHIRKKSQVHKPLESVSIHSQLLLCCFTLVSTLPFGISAPVNNFCRIFVPPTIQLLYNVLQVCVSILSVLTGQIFIRAKLFGESPCFEYHPLFTVIKFVRAEVWVAKFDTTSCKQLTFAKQFRQNPLIVINVMFWTKSLRALRCSQRLWNAPAFIRSRISSGISMLKVMEIVI